MTETKRPVGRPTKYKEEYCEEIGAYVRGDAYSSLEGFCAEIEICYDTLREWCKVYTEFSEAVKKAKMVLAARAIKRLMKCADEGIGNATANIFAVKNLAEDWRDKSDLNLGGQANNPIKTEQVLIDVNQASNAYEQLIKGR